MQTHSANAKLKAEAQPCLTDCTISAPTNILLRIHLLRFRLPFSVEIFQSIVAFFLYCSFALKCDFIKKKHTYTLSFTYEHNLFNNYFQLRLVVIFIGNDYSYKLKCVHVFQLKRERKKKTLSKCNENDQIKIDIE